MEYSKKHNKAYQQPQDGEPTTRLAGSEAAKKRQDAHSIGWDNTLLREKASKINIYTDFGSSWPKSSILQPIRGVGLNTPLLGYRQKVTISNR